MAGEFGGEWIHVYLWLSPSAVYLKLSHYLLTGYTSIQNKQLKKTKDIPYNTGDIANYL